MPANVIWGVVLLVTAALWRCWALSWRSSSSCSSALSHRRPVPARRADRSAASPPIVQRRPRVAFVREARAGPALVVGGGSIVLGFNVRHRAELGRPACAGPFATAAFWGLIILWLIAAARVAAAPRPDPRERANHQRSSGSPRLVILVSPVRYLALCCVSPILLVISTILVAALITISIAYFALVLAEYVIPAADRIEGRRTFVVTQLGECRSGPQNRVTSEIGPILADNSICFGAWGKTLICPNCGRRNPAGATFCSRCRQRLPLATNYSGRAIGGPSSPNPRAAAAEVCWFWGGTARRIPVHRRWRRDLSVHAAAANAGNFASATRHRPGLAARLRAGIADAGDPTPRPRRHAVLLLARPGSPSPGPVLHADCPASSCPRPRRLRRRTARRRRRRTQGRPNAHAAPDPRPRLRQPHVRRPERRLRAASNGNTVQFTNKQHRHRPDFLWDFGDGKGNSKVNPKHTLSDIGRPTYTVTLTVTDSLGTNRHASKDVHDPRSSWQRRHRPTPPRPSRQRHCRLQPLTGACAAGTRTRGSETYTRFVDG